MQKLQTGRNEPPLKVNVICGENNEVFEDLQQACKIEAFSFSPVKVKIDNKFDIANAIRKLDKSNCDIIAIIRGGGDISVFNEFEIVKAIVECEKPIVTALGHSHDVTMSDRAADKYLFTPTALGEYFKNIFLNKKKNISSYDLIRDMANLNQNMVKLATAFEGKTEKIISHFENRMIRKANLKYETLKAAFWIVAGIAITLNFLK